jgi:LuxR family quorum-sensing system transcriptional regulator CciR
MSSNKLHDLETEVLKMSRLEVVQKFVQLARASQTEAELFQLVEDITFEIGFRYFALINHVDLRRPPEGTIRLDNYPTSWTTYFVNEGLYVRDPILQASLTSNIGFTWTEVPRMIEITSTQRLIIECATKHGLGEGFTIPTNVPGESSGSCSFATRRGVEVPEANLFLAQLIGAFAFQAARRLNRIGSISQRISTLLTPRQRDCLLWAIRGKTDWEISRILGLKEETVTEYLNAARERYGVTKRLPLAIHAIFDGQISFIEALF